MTTCKCGKPTRDQRAICDICKHKLDFDLGNMTFLSQQLDATIAREKAAAISGGSASADKGLHWHNRAAEAKRTLRDYLILWVRYCHDEHVPGAPANLPAENLISLSRYLLHTTDALALRDIAPSALEEITDAVEDCRRIVFWKRRTRSYLGPCGLPIEDEDGNLVGEDCLGEVYADEGQEVGYCEDCGRGHTAVIRKAAMETELDAMLYTAAEIADLSTYLSLNAGREAVRKKVLYWHRHNRIEVKGKDDAGNPRFRYGEVRGMLAAAFTTPTQRSA